MIGETARGTRLAVSVVRSMLLFLVWGASPTVSFLRAHLEGRQPYYSITTTTGPAVKRSALWSSPLTTAQAAHEFLKDAEILELTLPDHRPLGCTVEESLGKEYPNVVFCSKVTPDGFAEKAGIQSGDVFVGVSGMFGNVEDVTVAGIDRVKSLVAACPDDEPLILRLARGTPVLVDHEKAIVEICSNPDVTDIEVEECVTDFLSEGYYKETSKNGKEVGELEESSIEDDDGMLDNMFNMWAEDLPPTPSAPAEPEPAEEKSKPKPWSSRSSPSGTFVRDPRTGKMRNIDA